jgi:hypothetical protein
MILLFIIIIIIVVVIIIIINNNIIIIIIVIQVRNRRYDNYDETIRILLIFIIFFRKFSVNTQFSST